MGMINIIVLSFLAIAIAPLSAIAETKTQQDAINGIRHKIENIDITKLYTEESVCKYPLYKGESKVVAKEKRRELFQTKILDQMIWTALIATYNKNISVLLDDKTNEPLPSEKQGELKEKFRSLLAEYDIDLDKTGDLSNELWEKRGQVKSVININDYSFRAVKNDSDESYYGGAPSDSGNLLKSKTERTKYLLALLVMSIKIEAKRLNLEEVSIKLTIDFPQFFKTYPLKDLKDLVEK